MTEASGRVADKVVLITGGARGMGAAHARLFAAEGAKVVIADVLDAEGHTLADELEPNAFYVHLDVSKQHDWKRAVALADEEFGPIDVLVNNAGIVQMHPLVDYPLDAWNTIIGINLTGALLGMQAVAPSMIERKRGSIVNISSIDGLAGSPQLHGYVAAKFGLRGLTKSAALELAPHGIRVNSVHPGLIETPMTVGLDASIMPIPLGREARSDEVSQLVLFLASDEASYCTGSEFTVDGGLMAGIPMNAMPELAAAS